MGTWKSKNRHKYLWCWGQKMPYELFRTSYFHISVATSVGAKRVPLAHSTLSNIRISWSWRSTFMLILGGSLSLKTTPVQAHRGFRLLTLASWHTEICSETFLHLQYLIDFMQVRNFVINVIIGRCNCFFRIVPAGEDSRIVAAFDIAGERVSHDQQLLPVHRA